MEKTFLWWENGLQNIQKISHFLLTTCIAFRWNLLKILKNLCCGLCLIKIHSEVGLTSVSNLLEFIETHFCSNESSSNRILMNDTNAMTLQIVFHNRETKTKLSRVRTTCHHYCLNAFHCVEVWPTKSSFIHADILWSPFSLSWPLKTQTKN